MSEVHVVDNIADAEVPKPVIKVGGAGVKEGWYFGTEDTTLTIEKAADQSDTVTNRTVYTVKKDRVEIYSGELPDNESSSTIFEEELGDGVWQVEAYSTRTVDGKAEKSETVTAAIKVDTISPDIAYVSGNPAD